MRHKPNVYARAARAMERRELAGVRDRYPCFYVTNALGYDTGMWERIPENYAWLNIFSDGFSTYDKSADFLRNIKVGTPEGRNESIIALGFAAAMKDAGDL